MQTSTIVILGMIRVKIQYIINIQYERVEKILVA